MKQWMARKTFTTLSALSLSLVAGAAFAQLIEIEDPAQAQGAQQAEQQLPQTPRNNGAAQLPSQPVTISSGMAPEVAPQAQPVQAPQAAVAMPSAREARMMAPAQQAGQPIQMSSQPTQISVPSTSQVPVGMSVSTPATGIGGNNPGNANTGGVQVQSVNVVASQDQNQSRAEFMRRERMRKELENESRVVEKIEEGRLQDESQRARMIEDFKASNKNSTAAEAAAAAPAIQSAPVAPIGAPTSMMTPATGTVITPVSADEGVSLSAVKSDSTSAFKLAPFAGRRWFENGAVSEMHPNNLFVVGATLEGAVNSYLSIEGSFSYGRDEFNYSNYGMSAYAGGFVGAGYGPSYYNNPYAQTPYYGSYAVVPVRSRDTFEIGTAVKIGTNIDRVRPYGIAGIGGILQRYNIDDSYTTAAANSIGWQRSTTNMLGDFGGGLDLSLAKNMSAGARFDYQPVLNRQYSEMNRIYGDAQNRYRVTGNFQLIF